MVKTLVISDGLIHGGGAYIAGGGWAYNRRFMVLISSSCNKCVKIRLVVTCHLQTCYNLLKQLAASL